MLVVRPAWFPRSGVLLGTVTVMALPGTFLTVGAGEALRNALHLNGGFGPAALIARHAHAGMLLRDLMVLFTGAVIVVLFAHRVAAGMDSGVAWLDGPARHPAVLILLRVALAVLAVLCAYFVFHTGDLGAKAVWQGRLSGGGPGRWRRGRAAAVRPRWRLGVSLRSTSLGPSGRASVPGRGVATAPAGTDAGRNRPHGRCRRQPLKPTAGTTETPASRTPPTAPAAPPGTRRARRSAPSRRWPTPPNAPPRPPS
jgi:hypothetical protein